ncbi:hypothetical protein ACXJJ3_19095 [Kribbella sp. WER1]
MSVPVIRRPGGRTPSLSDRAMWIRRIALLSMTGAVAEFATFMLLGPLDRFASHDAERFFVLAVNLVLIPAGVFWWRERIWHAADGMAPRALPRPLRSEWSRRARLEAISQTSGSLLGLTTVWFGALFSLLGAWNLAFELRPTPTVFWTVFVVGAFAICVYCVWVYRTSRADCLETFANRTPPQMDRVYRLQDQTRALEQVLHEATSLSEELQLAIEADKKLIGELRDEASKAMSIADLSDEQLAVLTEQIKEAHRTPTARGILIGVINLLAGYFLSLVSPGWVSSLFHDG